jgi:hypothetical protein
VLILLGLTASSAFGVGNAGSVTGGTFPACVNPANTNTSTVKLAGKQVNPGGLVRVPTGSSCLSSETTLNLNSYIKTILVSPAGADNVANGTLLRNVVTAATAGTLIKIEPGTYDLGTTTLTLVQGVDLEGSGEKLTKITSQTTGTTPSPSAGTIILASNSEIRFLTIENTGASSYNTAIFASGINKTVKLTNVTLSVSGASNFNYALYNTNSSSPLIQNSTLSASGGTQNYAIYNATSSSPSILNSTLSATGGQVNYGVFSYTSSAPTIQNSTIIASDGLTTNYGLYTTNSSTPTIQNSTITTSGGSFNFAVYTTNSGSPTIQNSTITAKLGTTLNDSLNNSTANSSARVAGSKLDGAVENFGGTLTCINDYKADFTALSATCT